MTEGARDGLHRCREFLADRNLATAERAGQVIARQFRLLAETPAMGRSVDRQAGLRELVIGFGTSGYVALYRHDADEDIVVILAFRHQREAGY